MDAATVLLSKIRSMIDDRTMLVTGGSITTFDEYKRLVGVIDGLRLAERELLELERQQMEMDDDE